MKMTSQPVMEPLSVYAWAMILLKNMEDVKVETKEGRSSEFVILYVIK